MMDFNDIMEDNSHSGELVAAISSEIDTFDSYVHGSDPIDTSEWEKSVAATQKAFDKNPLVYKRLGEERYALLSSLRTAYSSYSEARNEVIDQYQSGHLDIDKLYDVYSMQKYLNVYAQRFVDKTMREGNFSYKELMPVIVSVPFLVAALGVIIILVIYKMSKVMDNSISVPVLKLANASRKIAANDFFIDDVEADNKDEMGELVTAFNKMKYATGEYIRGMEDRRIVLDQLHAKELENLEIEKQMETMNLELLKSQINPHFLFNTLNVIKGTANLEDAPTTEQMIEALSSLFRYNLKNQAKEALLAQELKISRDYMYLQKMRFGDRVSFEVDSDVDENKVIVPTFTFQPLLENAIIHGISHKVEGGKILIKIRQNEDMLHIEVSDTGEGMDEELLEKVRAQLEIGNEKVIDKDIIGIGLGNINRRIRTMYKGGSLRIESTKNVGTTIIIDIPMQGDVV
ncbi:sensor histidine kinase [Butyrivibrio sp. INlla18]|uniref:sensor histidine kinase n=1 Tax=Butyrivibrio sp. INlla18 TaxID=1520806 RepID=UPI001FA6D05B|nr:sensor histidine kinase [Butyrivibrio sp. INlla18]